MNFAGRLAVSRAVFAMAPALGPGIEESSLRAIEIPVQVVASKDDELLPFERHAAHYARHIPDAQLTGLPKGGHFVFMPECTFMGKVFTYFHEYDICGRRAWVDRAGLHAQIVHKASRFFNVSLSGEKSAATGTLHSQ